MTVHIAAEGCVALSLDADPGQEECVRLVREVLSENGLSVWEGMHISLFCAEGRSLLIASPGSSVTVAVAPWLAPLL